MSSEENMRVIRTWVDAINRNDIETELSCWQPDGEFHVISTDSTFKGIEQIKRAGEVSASYVALQPVEGRKQISNLFATAEWGCVEYHTDATVTGPVKIKDVEIIPKGVTRTTKQLVCVIFHFRGGKFDVGREYFDTSTYARQLGLSPTMVAELFSSFGSESKSQVK